MKNEKYELTEETKVFNGNNIYRIKALKDFNDVKKGDLGGWVEKEYNLSQEGNCWVYNDAVVGDEAVVRDNAVVCDHVMVCDNTVVYKDAVVWHSAKVFGNATIGGCARVYGVARVGGTTKVYGNAVVCGNAVVFDNAVIDGNAKINNDAFISAQSDYLIISNMGSREDTTTFYKNKYDGINVNCGCFNGTIENFEIKVKETHKGNEFEEQYLKAIEIAKIVIKTKEGK